MKIYICSLGLLFCMLLGTSVAAQDDAPAAAAYQQGDYATAITQYENALENSRPSGELYYNLGITHYEAGNIGEAMLYLLRAKQYIPRDAQLQRALTRVRAERTNLIGDEADLLVILAQMTADILTFRELTYSVFGLWVIFFGVVSWHILFTSARGSEWLLWGVGGLLCIGLICLSSRWYVERHHPQAVIMPNTIAVKSGAGDDYLTLYTLFEAAEIRIYDRRDQWIRFRLADGHQGWVPLDAIEQVNP